MYVTEVIEKPGYAVGIGLDKMQWEKNGQLSVGQSVQNPLQTHFNIFPHTLEKCLVTQFRLLYGH